MLVTWIGIRYRIPAIIALVLCGLAVFAFVMGVQMIVTRRAAIPTSGNRSHHKEYHTGLGAQLWGVMFILMSVFVGAFGFVFWRYGNEPPADLITRLAASPLISGGVIVATGAGIGMYGLTRLVAGNAPFTETKLRPVERMLGGVWACIVGSLVVVAGLVRALSPGTLTRMRDATIASVLQLFR